MELGQIYNISSIDTSWVGIVDIVDNIANVQVGNSEITISVPITTTDVVKDIKTYLGVSSD